MECVFERVPADSLIEPDQFTEKATRLAQLPLQRDSNNGSTVAITMPRNKPYFYLLQKSTWQNGATETNAGVASARGHLLGPIYYSNIHQDKAPKSQWLIRFLFTDQTKEERFKRSLPKHTVFSPQLLHAVKQYSSEVIKMRNIVAMAAPVDILSLNAV